MEVKINSNKFTEYIPVNHGFSCVRYEEGFFLDIPEYRISSTENIFVSLIAFINKKFIDKIVKSRNPDYYTEIENKILNSEFNKSISS